MFFLLLGFKNASRNMDRSIIAIVSMAFATAFITYSISLGRGYPPTLHAAYRSIIGGEISVYSLLFDLGDYTGDDAIVYQRLESSPLTDLSMWHPECFTSGFLSLEDHHDDFSSNLLTQMELNENIKAVYPHYQFPVASGSDTSYNPRNHWGIVNEVNLRGRDIDIDAKQFQHPKETISQGRWFTEDDEGKMVCIIPQYQKNVPRDAVRPAPGEKIALHLPRITQNEEGYLFDHLNPITVEVEVIGVMEIPSRFLNWKSADGVDEIEYIYWLSNEIQLPHSTWLNLWELAGGGTYQPEQYTLLVEEIALFEDTLSGLRKTYPEFTFVSVVDQLERALREMKWESQPRSAPRRAYESYPLNDQGYFQEDLRLPISIMLSMTAALVIASNLLIMVSERKKEIAVLKAIGTERHQLIVMILGEAFFLAALGGSIGFTIIWAQNLLIRSGTTSILYLLSSMVMDLLMVLASALAVAFLFGMLPALRMANQSVMEVLRSE